VIVRRVDAHVHVVPDRFRAEIARRYYDTGLAANTPAVASTAEVAAPRRIAFGTGWPYADLPDAGDPAPDLSALFSPSERGLIDGINIVALVRRLMPGTRAHRPARSKAVAGLLDSGQSAPQNRSSTHPSGK
jgi:hypothetical protein